MSKKITLCILSLVMTLGLCIPVFAAEDSSKAPFSFTLTAGGASVPSDRAYKDDTTAAEVYPSTGTVSTSKNVAFRIRNAAGTAATGLYQRDDLMWFAMYYLTGMNSIDYKYLYANAPSTNAAGTVTMSGNWYP